MKNITTTILLFILSLGIASAELMYVESGTPVSAAGYGDSGISFQVSTTIEVTDLSFFGESLGGGDTPYVQLWNDDTDTQLGIVNWGAGEAGAGWNSKTLSSPVTLSPGINYQVQSQAYWVPRYTDSSSFSFGSEITSTSFQHDGGWTGWGVQVAPSSTTITADLPAMVNFTYTAIPEPSTILMTLLGFGLVGLTTRRRR